jgi:predicted metallopeptidase
VPIEYSEAPDVKRLADEIADSLDRIWQETLNLPPSYVIEVISERYDELIEEEKEKTIIHELLHIPKGFTGGFRPHKGYIDHEIVENLHRTFKKQRTSKR